MLINIVRTLFPANAVNFMFLPMVLAPKMMSVRRLFLNALRNRSMSFGLC